MADFFEDFVFFRAAMFVALCMHVMSRVFYLHHGERRANHADELSLWQASFVPAVLRALAFRAIAAAGA